MSVATKMASSYANIVSHLGSRSDYKSKPSIWGRATDIIFAGVIVLLVLFFAPMAWWYFPAEPDTPNYGDKVLAALVSPEFAYGEGSGAIDGPPMLALIRNMATMKPHMQAGTIATIVGFVQFSPTLQFKYPVVHRSLGRVYGLCVAIIMGSSASFLFDAVPRKEVFSGEFFGQILAVLTLAVPATMLFALQAIWSGDVSSHREFMTLNYSLMLSAPLLRTSWILLAQVWDQPKDVVNLFSTVIVAPILVVAPILYLRRHHARPGNARLLDLRVRLASAAAGLMGLVFCAYKLPSLDKWPFPVATFVTLVLPLLAYAVVFAVLAEQARRRQDQAACAAWETYLNGLISSPAWAPALFYLGRDVFAVPEQHLGITTMNNAISTGLTAGFTAYVFATAKGRSIPLSAKNI
ncbi:uncharacterized protein K489DRAFT_384326 [Dissoconium aciculare CBS 342.82]|uniref:Uncharacterized protein n=1 Tax=Dissoconium aciculare CBS 342.82 TaxID=1314786 RepID=A0A6J3LW31_9PEZI|nr:uncharacterized protein K489DRAFT_384326 [Dissoconium aciculare CBS 342.82]KAF1818837.1 hypothetical protein K489DRAFT_384326 [Dissoconium aciculare CBS 342.82]